MVQKTGTLADRLEGRLQTDPTPPAIAFALCACPFLVSPARSESRAVLRLISCFGPGSLRERIASRGVAGLG